MVFLKISRASVVLALTIAITSTTGCSSMQVEAMPTPTVSESVLSIPEATPTQPVDCPAIFEQTANVSVALGDVGLSSSKVRDLLSSAASTWSTLSKKNKGSRSEWLAKMAELSLKLKKISYSDSAYRDSMTAFQLSNNMNLANQFCE
jgi:hypothetical protein